MKIMSKPTLLRSTTQNGTIIKLKKTEVIEVLYEVEMVSTDEESSSVYYDESDAIDAFNHAVDVAKNEL